MPVIGKVSELKVQNQWQHIARGKYHSIRMVRLCIFIMVNMALNGICILGWCNSWDGI